MNNIAQPKIAAFAGGVGGARMANGLAQLLPPEQLSIIVNTGDDFEYWGLSVSPDLDTVMYTLAGIANPQTGWGLLDEGHRCLENMRSLGQPAWFGLGDRDLATHLTRTHWLHEGQNLTQVTRSLGEALGVNHAVLPMSNDPCRTIVLTPAGEMDFQTYFVREQWQPQLTGLRWEGLSEAHITPEVRQALIAADLIFFCPSNPFVSIDPILNLPGVLDLIKAKPVVAISPIIGGKAIKGPAAKMFDEFLHTEASAYSVAAYYQHRGLLKGFVIDHQDQDLESKIATLGLDVLVTNTLLPDPITQKQVARVILDFVSHLV